MSFYRKPQTNDFLVIERDITSSSQCNTPDYYTYLAIAFIYAFFMALFVDKLLNFDQVEKVCEAPNTTGSVSTDKIQACKKAQDEYNTRKLTYMIILGVCSVFGGAFLAGSNKMYETGGCGVATGGSLLILYYTAMNWKRFDKNVQLAILGLSFIVMFYGSIHAYQKY